MRKHGYYAPDEGASPDDQWGIALLSQRDLGLRIPVNFLTKPGVSLRAACFAHGVYETDAAAKCLSNLMAMGYQRFDIDLYWDTTRSVWGLCPAQMLDASDAGTAGSATSSSGTSAATGVSTLSTAPATQSSSSSTANPARLDRRQSQSSSNTVTSAPTVAGQTSSHSSSPLPASSNSSSTAGNATAVPAQSGDDGDDGDDDDVVLQIGPYTCSTDLDMLFLGEVMEGYMHSTQDILRAFTVYVTLNLHAASPKNDATGPAQQPVSSALPFNNTLLSATVNTNLSSYLYTPLDLRDEQTNLNNTWYNFPYEAQPDSHYYNISTDQAVFTTSDGWPSESYVEFQLEKRLLIAIGSIDPQMQAYNVSLDGNLIFQNNTFSVQRSVTFSRSDTISSGCFYDAGLDGVSGANNNSYATSVVSPSLLQNGALDDTGMITFAAVNNLTSCGISPFLNETLSNVTADQNSNAYLGIPLSAVWSWSAGEPRNVSSGEDDDQRIRCAVLDTTLQGHWRVGNCGDQHYSACRVNDQPYEWAISSSKQSYSESADDACGDGQRFSAPRTGLENTYLFHAWQNTQNTDGDTSLWVNFNSLDQVNCWVAGVNSSCPYADQSADDRAKTVIVPTVAAVVIFVLAALTLFVKCAANRRSSKRRRRRKGEDGWDYEGVPS